LTIKGVTVLISNIGLFWREDYVFWGAGSQAGKLLGVDARNVTGNVVDFRNQIGIYALYADYDLVYVGQVGAGNQRLMARLKQHRKDDLANRWNRFSWFGTRPITPTGDRLRAERGRFHPTLLAVLNHIEGILIHVAEPALNGQGGRFGERVHRFQQVRDERLGLPDSELLRSLCQERGIAISSVRL
jgi:hypothetical protein